MTAETPVQRMVSKETLRVKHAPDMSFLETVSHLTFLLSKPNLQFVKGKRSKRHETLVSEIKKFARKQKDKLSPKSPKSPKSEQEDEKSDHGVSACTITANAAAKMFEELRQREDSSPRDVPRVSHIRKGQLKQLIKKAKRCFAWAHDPARVAMPGAENVTNDQV